MFRLATTANERNRHERRPVRNSALHRFPSLIDWFVERLTNAHPLKVTMWLVRIVVGLYTLTQSC